MNYELMFLKALGFTIFIETLVLIGFFRWVVKLKDTGISRLLMTGLIASFATLPYLWFVLPKFIESQLWYIIIAESFAVLGETIIIGVLLRVKFRTAFLCSLTCNTISFLIGLLIMG